MRARLMMKLFGVIVMLVLTIVGARSCSSSSASSPLNPATVEQNGLSGLCANEAATAAAAGDTSAPTLQVNVPADLANAAKASGLTSGTFSCSSTTVAGGSTP
jgi:hypothetical protein